MMTKMLLDQETIDMKEIDAIMNSTSAVANVASTPASSDTLL